MKADRPYTLQPHELRAQARAERDACADPLPAEQRPQTRADCVHGPRPCPWLGCRYHLWLDVHPDAGSVKVNQPAALEWILGDDEGPAPSCESCALDVAEDGALDYDEIGEVINVGREGARKAEIAARRSALKVLRFRPSMVGLRSASAPEGDPFDKFWLALDEKYEYWLGKGGKHRSQAFDDFVFDHDDDLDDIDDIDDDETEAT